MAAEIGCAIVDANAVSDVFGDAPSEAGASFRRWINSGDGQLVSGGKLQKELCRASGTFRLWVAAARAAGQLTVFSPEDLQSQIDHFESHRNRRSNDAHVLALAMASGARLLYTNDEALQRDFRDHTLINNPRGRVFSTRVNRQFDRQKRELLRTAPPCRAP